MTKRKLTYMAYRPTLEELNALNRRAAEALEHHSKTGNAVGHEDTLLDLLEFTNDLKNKHARHKHVLFWLLALSLLTHVLR